MECFVFDLLGTHSGRGVLYSYTFIALPAWLHWDLQDWVALQRATHSGTAVLPFQGASGCYGKRESKPCLEGLRKPSFPCFVFVWGFLFVCLGFFPFIFAVLFFYYT